MYDRFTKTVTNPTQTRHKSRVTTNPSSILSAEVAVTKGEAPLGGNDGGGQAPAHHQLNFSGFLRSWTGWTPLHASPAVSPENDNDLELEGPTNQHGCGRFLGEPAARCWKE